MEDGSSTAPYGIKSDIIQVALCIIANIAGLSAGMSLGFSAVALPYMQEEGSYINVTNEQASWIASLAAMTTPLGCLVSGPILDRWGRKVELLIVNLPSLIGWLLIAIEPDLIRLYIGRSLTGIGVGLISMSVTVYFAEVSTKSMRGFLIAGNSITTSVGILIVYILGYFLKEDWRMVALICAIFPVVAAVLIAAFLPESPQWLVSKGRNKEAYISLRVLRGVSTNKDVELEFNMILSQNMSTMKDKLTVKETIHSFFSPEVYKPFLIMVMLFAIQQFSGVFVIVYYAVDIVQNSRITVDPFLVSVAIGIITLIFAVIAAWMSKRIGRRLPAIVSGIGMTVSLTVMIFHLYSENHNTLEKSARVNETSGTIDLNSTLDEQLPATSSISWVPLLSLLFYVLFSTIGIYTVPWAIVGEVFPSHVRGVAGGLTTCLAYLMSFIIVKAYPFLLDIIQETGVYLVFDIVAFLGTIFIIVFLPETQGKTLQEIEQYFSK